MKNIKNPKDAVGQVGTLRIPERHVDNIEGSPRIIRHFGAGKISSKEKVVAFKFPALVERIENDMKVSSAEALALFRDMLRFLYLCGSGRRTAKQPLSPPRSIDKAWHTFLLFTRDYQKFCHVHFGFFIHHVPLTRKARRSIPARRNMAIKAACKVFGRLSKHWVSQSEDCDQCTSSRD